MLNLEPIKLNEEQFAQLAEASSEQTVGKQMKSNDPKFPVFDIPVNEKIMVYVPNFTMQTKDGGTDIVKDRFVAHTVRDGKNFKTVRCTNGLNMPEVGLDGSCPLCEGAGTCWDLFNFEFPAQAKMKGINTSDTDSDDVKTLRQQLKSKFAVRGGEVWYTFPIVVVDTVTQQNGQITPNVTGNQLSGTPYWYSIRESTYNKRWKKILNSMMPAKDHPAGMWFVLDYTYDSKDGQHDKMGSANALVVTSFEPSEELAYLKQYEAYFDDISKEFTPVKAMTTVYANMISSVDSLQKLADTVLQQTNDQLRLYQNSSVSPMLGGSAPAPAINNSADAMLQNFGAIPVQATTGTASDLGATPQPITQGTAPQVALGQVPPSMGVQ